MIETTPNSANYCREQILASLIPTSLATNGKSSNVLLEITMDALFDSLTGEQQKQVIRFLSSYIKQRYTPA